MTDECIPYLVDRLKVVDAARKWLGTPYHNGARVIGSGVDCAQLLACAFVEAGVLAPFIPDRYASDWHLHRGEEKYLGEIERYASLIDPDRRPLRERDPDFNVLPGDILMFRNGRTFSHSAMVTCWPKVIHAYAMSEIVEEVNIRGTIMAEKPMLVYSVWGKSTA